MRVCNGKFGCGLEKDDSSFIKRTSLCRDCRNLRQRILRRRRIQKDPEAFYKKEKLRLRQFRKNNPEANKIHTKNYRLRHPERNAVSIKKWKTNNLKKYREISKVCSKIWGDNNKNRVRLKNKLYRQNNKEKIKHKQKLYYHNVIKNNIFLTLRQKISASVCKSIKKAGGSKNNKSILNYLTYSIEKLKLYLESFWEPWMSWENYGKYIVDSWNDQDQLTWKWNIDHVIPQSDLPYTSMDDENFKKCWALENLRPYSAKQNTLDGVSKIRHQKNK